MLGIKELFAEYKPPYLLTKDQWVPLSAQLLQAGYRIGLMGILDDMDPTGGVETACQKSYENALAQGLMVDVRTQIRENVFQAQSFRIFPPTNSK